MKDFGNLVNQAKKLQAQLETLKEEVGKRKVEASAGGFRHNCRIEGDDES